MNIKEQIRNVAQLCDKVAEGITKRNQGIPNCSTYCPGEQKLISAIESVLPLIEKREPEFVARVRKELSVLVGPVNSCVNPYAFGAIVGLWSVLNAIYSNAGNGKRVFISHSSKDEQYITKFVNQILALGIGISLDDIFCTSIEDLGIKNGEDIRKHIQDNIRSAEYSFLMISDNYKASEICVNEMGAVWSYDAKVRLYMLPGAKVDMIGWLCDTRQAQTLSNPTALDQLYKEMRAHFGISTDNFEHWSRIREDFVRNIN